LSRRLTGGAVPEHLRNQVTTLAFCVRRCSTTNHSDLVFDCPDARKARFCRVRVNRDSFSKTNPCRVDRHKGSELFMFVLRKRSKIIVIDIWLQNIGMQLENGLIAIK
jgi:hypothetical protein